MSIDAPSGIHTGTPPSPKELKEIIDPEKALEQAVYGFHHEFDTNIWPVKNPDAVFIVGSEKIVASYHHERHLMATREATKAVFAQNGTDDLFGIRSELAKWNTRHNQELSEGDLQKAMDYMFLIHDIGNIAEDDQLNFDGSISYASLYRGESGPTEDRGMTLGIKLAKFHLQNDPVALAMFEKFEPLILHLGKQTNLVVKQQDEAAVTSGKKKSEEIEDTFRTIVQCIDQSWSYTFSPDSVFRNSAGFIAEKAHAVMSNGESAPSLPLKGSLLFPDISTQVITGMIGRELKPEETSWLAETRKRLDEYAVAHNFTPLTQRMKEVKDAIAHATPEQNVILGQIIPWENRESVKTTVATALELEKSGL